MGTNELIVRSSLNFFVLVYVLSILFWALGALIALQLLPALPISALGFVSPVVAAAILIHRKKGFAGIWDLLRRSFDLGRIGKKAWFILVLFFEPGVMVLSFVVMQFSGVPIPNPQISLLPFLALFVVFFVGGLGEELGWSGYAIDPLQTRYGALRASLILGVVWAVWHFIPLLEAQRSPEFIAWWSLETVALKVIIVWLYNNTGRSVFVAAIFQAMINLTWQLFPVNGSFYDPKVSGLITAIAATFVVIGRGLVIGVRAAADQPGWKLRDGYDQEDGQGEE